MSAQTAFNCPFTAAGNTVGLTARVVKLFAGIAQDTGTVNGDPETSVRVPLLIVNTETAPGAAFPLPSLVAAFATNKYWPNESVARSTGTTGMFDSIVGGPLLPDSQTPTVAGFKVIGEPVGAISPLPFTVNIWMPVWLPGQTEV